MAKWQVTVPLNGPAGDEALDKIREVASVALLIEFEDDDPYDLAVRIGELNQELAAMGVQFEVGKPRRVRQR